MSSLNPYEPPPIPEVEPAPERKSVASDDYDVPPFRSPLVIGVICLVLMGLQGLGCIVEAYRTTSIYLLQRESIPEELVDADAIAAWTSWQPASYIFGLLVSLTASGWLIAWMFRTHRNLESLGHHELDSKHIWVILCWFVPVLNLFCPFLVMREIWWRSYPDSTDSADSAPASHMVFWWWLLRVAAVATAYLTQLFSSYETWPQYYTYLRTFMLSSGCELVSVILGILIIYRISHWQIARYQRTQETAVPS